MANNFAELAFGTESKKLQERFGSRHAYSKMENSVSFHGITGQEEYFISERDGFYLSSIGQSGYPYIQFRGGPKGFIKVIDDFTLAFLDFRGNKQYISVGNVSTQNKVALFFMDYANRARLKIYALAEVIELGQDLILEKSLMLEGYQATNERIIKLTVQAFDWNCPQHITPKYTAEEIKVLIANEMAYTAQLEDENKKLRETIKALKGQIE